MADPYTIDSLRADLEHFDADVEASILRLTAQLEFAEQFAAVIGTKSWSALLAKAYQVAAEVAPTGSATKLNKALKDIETILAPIGKQAKTCTLHCVGHAHIDMNWMWSWPETVAVTNDTFTTMLALMDEFPEFTFSQSQASVYALIHEHNPDLLKRIARRVREGRWEIAAVDWVEGDKNLPTGESMARHLLYTRRFVKEHFDLDPEDCPVEWEPDTFGHALSIPSISARGGVKYYYMCRGGRGERPSVFWWEAPDGQRILVNIEQAWYNDYIGPQNAGGFINYYQRTGLKDWLLVYGVGDHGGGPTRRDLRMAREIQSWPIYPTFKFSTAKAAFEALEKQGDKLPVFKGELNYEFPGCYTSQSLIKKTNRLGEHRNERADLAAALAWRKLGRDYPADRLAKAWTDTIFGHFHDILPGSGVAATREYQSGQYQQTTATTQMITTLALRELAGKVDTSFADTGRSLKVSPARQSTHFGAGVGWGAHAGDATTPSHQDESTRSFVVFNPTAWARREVVKVTVWTGYGQWQIGKQHPDRRYRLRRGDGNCEAVQKVDEGYYWGHQYVDFAVPVEVPALGYTSFSIEDVGPEIVGGFGYPQPEAEKSDQDATNSAKFDLGRGGIVPPVYILENEYLQAEIDKTTGGLSRLVDKATGRNLIRPDAAAQLEYLLERPGEMSSWVIYPARQRQCPLTLVSLRDDQQGPSEASTIATFKVNDSTITQTYRLRRGAKQLDMHFDVAWREIGYREKGCPTLRYEVPLAVSEPAGRYETPFGWVDRDVNDGREVPSQRFVDIVGKPDGASGKVGCCLLNDSKYGFSLDDSTLRVSLLRSSYEPDRVPETGDHEFNLALRPHDGKATPADLIQWGASCNHPLQVVGTGIHAGELPAQGNEGVHVTGKQVLLAAVKKAEDDDALIVRLIEATGQAATTTVSLDKALFGTVGDVTAVDLLERTVEDDSLSKSANGFKIKLPPRGIASVKVSFA